MARDLLERVASRRSELGCPFRFVLVCLASLAPCQSPVCCSLTLTSRWLGAPFGSRIRARGAMEEEQRGQPGSESYNNQHTEHKQHAVKPL